MSNNAFNTDESRFQVKLIEVTNTEDGDARENLQENGTHITGDLWLFEGDEYALDGVTFTVVGEAAMEAYGDLSKKELMKEVSAAFGIGIDEVVITEKDCIGRMSFTRTSTGAQDVEMIISQQVPITALHVA